jgi:hypothetical protein
VAEVAPPTGGPQVAAGAPRPDGRARRRLALAVLLAPAAWALHLSVGVALVPVSCDRGTEAWMHLSTALTLALAMAGAVLSRRALGRAQDGDEATATDLFVARLGWWGAVFLTGLVLVEGLLPLSMDACS